MKLSCTDDFYGISILFWLFSGGYFICIKSTTSEGKCTPYSTISDCLKVDINKAFLATTQVTSKVPKRLNMLNAGVGLNKKGQQTDECRPIQAYFTTYQSKIACVLLMET